MESFNIQRSLLNPKFETYKLDRLSQDEAVLRYDLPYKASRVAPSGKMPLTFQEMQSRISHNHLSLLSETGQAVYVDSEYRVIIVTLANPPIFRVVYELPRHLPASVPTVRSEYPSTAFLRSDVIFVADGNGLLHVLKLTSEGNADVLGVLTVSPGPLHSPFRIHTLHRESPNVALVIVSARHYDPDLTDIQRSLKPGDIQFDVYAIRVDLSILNPKEVVPLDVIWQRRGKEVPMYTGYDSTLDAFLLIGGSVYRETTAPVAESYQPSPDEYVPIPSANENFDSEEQVNPKPYPYSWTQTSDSITITFPLPSNTPKSSIQVTLSPKTLTLHVDPQDTTDPAIPIPEYSSGLLWDGISPTTSFWTWDREAEHTFGLLTLHLDKANEGTRWMQIFAAANTLPDNAQVPETLDPSELWHIREALEKYTASLGRGESDAGLGTGVPSLAEGEMDEEADQSVGREAYQTWISTDGSVPAWWINTREIPFHLLSTPFPGDDALGRGHTFIIKSHIDGAVFHLQSSANPPRWEHTSTYSALAFVLASKRDTCFTHHTEKAVFAFEGGVKDRGGNLYIYQAAPSSSNWAKQAIVKVDDGRGGSLLGVGVWDTMEATILVCLTEGELVLVKI